MVVVSTPDVLGNPRLEKAEVEASAAEVVA
jgi:hypothetical protein